MDKRVLEAETEFLKEWGDRTPEETPGSLIRAWLKAHGYQLRNRISTLIENGEDPTPERVLEALHFHAQLELGNKDSHPRPDIYEQMPEPTKLSGFRAIAA